MKILVTGGAGYVGSHAVEELVKVGYKVVVLDDLSAGHRAAVDPGAEFMKGDLRRKEDVEGVFAKYSFDVVFHFAARSLVGDSMRNTMPYIGDNVVSAINLFKQMVDKKIKKFIFSSTANLFGEAGKIPISEAEKIVPGTPYGEGKNIIERQLYWLDKVHRIRYVALRYFNAAGASLSGKIGEDHRPETHLIPIVLSCALGRKDKLTVYGNDYSTKDGTCVRDYIHVVDLVSAHILALKLVDKKSDVFNLGLGKGYSILEIIKMTQKVTGKKIKYEFGPKRPGDTAVLIASSDKIKKQLGWRPKYKLREIIKTAYKWHKNNPQGYKD